MRIIVAHNEYQQPGGEETVFSSEIDLLRQHGHEIFPYVRHNSELNRISPFTAAVETVWSRKSAGEISRLIVSTQAELVHFHNTFLRISPSAYYAVKAHDAAVVQTLHNYRLLCPVAIFLRDGNRCEDCIGKTPPWPGVLHACYHNSRPQTAVVASMLTVHRLLGTWTNKVDRYIAYTEFARRKFVQGGIPAEKISVKPHFVTRTPEVFPTLGNYALYAGRLSSEKGIEILLEAWKNVHGCPLKIAGDGPLRESVFRAAQTSSQIEWVGQHPRDEVLRLMAKAYVLIFPSALLEGLGLAGLEAFSVGLPVIAPRLGVMEEMITDGKTGLLYEPNNALDLSEKVSWAFQHRREMEDMREACLSVYEEKWSPDKNYKMLIDIYQQALNDARQS